MFAGRSMDWELVLVEPLTGLYSNGRLTTLPENIKLVKK